MAVSVEIKTPNVPSRACHGEVQYSETKMRTPLSGLLARITPVTPLSPHTASCSTNHLPDDTKKQIHIVYVVTFKQAHQNRAKLVCQPCFLMLNESCNIIKSRV